MRILPIVLLVSSLVAAPAIASDEADAVSSVLDDFHAAASAADEERYFAHFTANAVFLGTDASERWTVPQFRQFAHPHFSEGRGWIYVATERHVMFAADGAVAWFDEKLHNEKYGEVRGTGVLQRTGQGWKIAHYSLTFLVPNERSQAVVAVIRGDDDAPADAASRVRPGQP